MITEPMVVAQPVKSTTGQRAKVAMLTHPPRPEAGVGSLILAEGS
jgi:hypothetical protein